MLQELCAPKKISELFGFWERLKLSLIIQDELKVKRFCCFYVKVVISLEFNSYFFV